MLKKFIPILILLFIVGISGCTVKEAGNGTFGEKTISLDSIKVLNNTTSDRYEYNGTSYFYIEGYVQNNNKWDAFNVKMRAIAYDKDGKIFETNDTVYLDPKNIPGGGKSYFFFGFVDQNETITKYDVKLVDAKATP